MTLKSLFWIKIYILPFVILTCPELKGLCPEDIPNTLDKKFDILAS